jgi:predicted lysophospholipase L1 biosynthesis ABC-type transport system permease subunit
MGRALANRFRGFTFDVELGRSFVGTLARSSTPPRVRKLMLIGVSPRASQLALTVPLGALARWNRAYAGTSELSSVLLELAPGADVTRVTQAVRALGFSVADSGAERVGLALTLLTLLFALVSIAIVSVAAINIAHTFFRAVAERRREIGVLRAMGASARDVRSVLLAEAAAIGLAGGVAGLAVARAIAFALDAASRRLAPDFPFKPDSYFAFGWTIVVAAITCSVAACVAGALWPARAAARLDPTEALAAP